MPEGALRDVDADRRAFRLEAAKREIPGALMWTAAAIAVLSLAQYATSTDGDALPHLLHVGLVVVFAVAAYVVRLASCPAWSVPWVAAVAAVAAVLAMDVEIVRHPTSLGLAYVLIVMTAYGPFVLAMPPMLAAAIVMFASWILVAGYVEPGVGAAGWWIAGAAALIVSLVSLRVRLTSIDATADAITFTREIATRDPLTGALNRRGVEERMPDLLALAERQLTQVYVAFVDVDGLKAANDRYGHAFGDALIAAVARSIESSVRASDVVGRWGGDEFIVVGLGTGQDPDRLRSAVLAVLHARELADDRWSAGVSIGTATADPRPDVFELLLREADRDMYARREAERSGPAGGR